MHVELPVGKSWDVFNFVAGEFKKGSGKSVDVTSPYTGQKNS